jgi:hypothetical protein
MCVRSYVCIQLVHIHVCTDVAIHGAYVVVGHSRGTYIQMHRHTYPNIPKHTTAFARRNSTSSQKAGKPTDVPAVWLWEPEKESEQSGWLWEDECWPVSVEAPGRRTPPFNTLTSPFLGLGSNQL